MSKRSYRKSTSNGALTVAIITLVFVLVITTGITAVLSKGFADWSFIPWANAEEEVPPATDVTANVSNVKLALGPAIVSNNSVSREVTATVYPETAVNKAVDWKVEFEDKDHFYNIDGYVTVSYENGSTTAMLTCHQDFSQIGNVILTVTTRQSNRSDSCLVTFVGLPTEVSVQTDAEFDGYCYTLASKNTYEFDMVANNPFNSVKEDLEYDIDILASGLIDVGYYDEETDSWSDVVNHDYDTFYVNTVNISLIDSTVVVDVLCTPESYYNEETGEKTKSVNFPCYITVTVTEKNTGISKDFKIHLVEEIISSVDIQDENIEF